MVLSKEVRLAKLRELANIEGYQTIEEMLEEAACDAVSPAICTHEDCDYTQHALTSLEDRLYRSVDREFLVVARCG